MTEFLFSPLDTRYAASLPESLSEQAVQGTQIEVERAWLLTLMEVGLCPSLKESQLDEAWKGITAEEIAAVEQRTQHATRALVEVLTTRLEKSGHSEAAHWVHVGMTSFDCVDTAQRVRLKRFFEKDALQQIAQLKKEWRRLARAHQNRIAVGRTHGQWAVPTLFGLQFAEAHERVVSLEVFLKKALENLRGQASGAIGGYHASALLHDRPLELEERFLKRLGLKAHAGSTQILPPEDLLSVAQSYVSICGVATKVAQDMRHLARSEIGEIAEGFAPGQVGSSTMPQKRNPWNLEHVCSLYKVLLTRLALMESDLISEHQRDLTNSASGRFYFEVFMVGSLLIQRLTKVLSRLEVVESNIVRHLQAAGSTVYAEAFYILATRAGIAHAHDHVREAARKAEKENLALWDILARESWFPKDLTPQKLEERVLSGSHQKMQRVLSEWKD